ncbi:DUF4157 domain-containing protein [Jatrophihabitans sp.]|uniref:eCIS core domain-containing protein n=1 Tax=Jatrophihabitans sp. TaxID=1932789 RepID=UPI002C862682|nr:DUF4157 domain-containing protein [Jatrophihabitans sp.]
MPAALRSRHEARLGHDFSQVRVHDSERAARLSAGLGAEAFTVGRDILLGGPLGSADRTGLLAHELAHVVQLDGRDGLVLRQARPGAAAPHAVSAADRRDFVQSTIHFLESASDYYAQVTAAPPVERVLRQWQQMVEAQGRMVIDDLGADPALYQALRGAYLHALSTLIETAARLTNRPAAALFEQHRSLIPEWAFPTMRVPGITADVPTEAHVDRRGRASFTAGDVNVIVLPDRRNNAVRAKTTIRFSPYRISFRTRGGQVTSFTGPGQPVATIRTTYGRGLRPDVPSAYGRGTTAEDVAAGTTTLGFHEGSHARDFLRFFRERPYPQFTGTVGMPVREFRQAMADYAREVGQYAADLNAASLHGTDCVGTTIDQHDAQRGVRVRVQCAP